LGALVAAFAAVDDNVLFATAAASAVLKAAGERAARGSPGLGTFTVALIDALDALARHAKPFSA
jgi:hydroxyethylthiazole kinase